MKAKKFRCVIEFWAEKKNCLKRSRVIVKLNDNDVPFWVCPKKLIPLFNETAVYILYKKEWLISSVFKPDKNRKVVFIPVAPWERERSYFV